MALAPLTDDQLDELSDEELEQRVNDERNEGVEDTEEEIPGDEPENVDDGSDEEIVDEENENPEDNETEDEPDDEVEDEDSTTSEPGEENPDGETEPEEDDTKDETPETPIQEFEPLKVSGKQIPINSLDELYTLASGGAAVTQKFQEIAGHKKSISIMQEHGLTEADLSLLIEARNGSKDALASLVKQSGIDELDVTGEVSDGYQPGMYIPSDQQISLQDVQREISMDEEYGITQNVVNNVMDERSQQMLVQDPRMIRGLHADIKSGAYQHVSADAHKLKLMDGGMRSDIEYYIQAAQSDLQSRPQQQEQQVPQQQQEQVIPAKVVNKDKKRSASSNRQRVQTPSIRDIEDMSDDDLMTYREKIMERY